MRDADGMAMQFNPYIDNPRFVHTEAEALFYISSRRLEKIYGGYGSIWICDPRNEMRAVLGTSLIVAVNVWIARYDTPPPTKNKNYANQP